MHGNYSDISTVCTKPGRSEEASVMASSHTSSSSRQGLSIYLTKESRGWVLRVRERCPEEPVSMFRTPLQADTFPSPPFGLGNPHTHFSEYHLSTPTLDKLWKEEIQTKEDFYIVYQRKRWKTEDVCCVQKGFEYHGDEQLSCAGGPQVVGRYATNKSRRPVSMKTAMKKRQPSFGIQEI